jgi:hypothetical protein
MRIRYGKRYKVTEGAGLDSGRYGVAVDPRGKSQKFFKEIEPGRYYDFSSKREVLLRDESGEYFTMFKNYLKEISPAIVYKLVHHIGGNLYGSIAVPATSMFHLTYEIGKPTTAPHHTRNAHPFAFDDINMLYKFYLMYPEDQHTRMFEARTSEIVPQTKITQCFDYDMEKFWLGSRTSIHSAPAGTILCKDITLLREITKIVNGLPIYADEQTMENPPTNEDLI